MAVDGCTWVLLIAAAFSLPLLEPRQWNPDFQAYLERLRDRKPVFLVGDLNVAHNLEVDCYNPDAKHLLKQPGCTREEREAQTAFLESGWVDLFRHLNPEAKGQYSYWNMRTFARKENKGLRLDYAIVPERDMEGARGVRPLDTYLLHEDTVGVSDHCPLVLMLQVDDSRGGKSAEPGGQ